MCYQNTHVHVYTKMYLVKRAVHFVLIVKTTENILQQS